MINPTGIPEARGISPLQDDPTFLAVRDEVFHEVGRALAEVCARRRIILGDAVVMGLCMATSAFLVEMGREFEPEVEALAGKLGPLILDDFRKHAVPNHTAEGQA